MMLTGSANVFLDCGVHLRAGRDRSKKAEPGGQSLSNATDSERHALRENPILCALQTPEADAEFAESVNQLILFDI